MKKSLFNVGHFIAQATKNKPWNIIDIIITIAFVHNT